MRQYQVEKPVPEKLRRASSWLTLGFSVRMTAVPMVRPEGLLLSEIDPQANDRDEQHTRKHQIDHMFRLRLFPEIRRSDIRGLKFFVHCRKGEPCDLFPLRRRVHHADADEHKRADDEHENGVVQKVHIHQPADGARIVVPGLIQYFEKEAYGAEDKT